MTTGGRPFAYGGVIIDTSGRILLREPTNHYDGYVWTFSKGRPEGGESEEQTALRETCEETGVVTTILARLPGIFPGGTTRNVYFLMRPTGEICERGPETASVHWTATPEEARRMLGQTTNPTGRTRDLAVLDAALALNKRPPVADLGPGEDHASR